MARVTVCIPVYNGMPYVAPAVDSVLAQTFGDFELFVIDNQSTDGTVAALRRYGDKRLRVLVNDRNLGAEGNWNRALELSSAPYFKLLCADDLLRRDCLERQVAVLDAPGNERIGMVSCARDVIDPDGRVLLRRGPRKKRRIDGKRAIRQTVRAGANLLGEPGAVLLRAEAVRQAGRFDGAHPYLIDLDYWCRVLMHWDLYLDPEPLASFRVSPAQWSVAVAGSQGRDFAGFVDKLRAAGAPLNAAESAWGKARGYANGVLRQLFYKLKFGT